MSGRTDPSSWPRASGAQMVHGAPWRQTVVLGLLPSPDPLTALCDFLMNPEAGRRADEWPRFHADLISALPRKMLALSLPSVEVSG